MDYPWIKLTLDNTNWNIDVMFSIEWNIIKLKLEGFCHARELGAILEGKDWLYYTKKKGAIARMQFKGDYLMLEFEDILFSDKIHEIKFHRTTKTYETLYESFDQMYRFYLRMN